MIDYNMPGKLFTSRFRELSLNNRFIEFKDDWLKDGVYYDNIHQHLKLKVGEMYGSYDHLNSKRLIIIGTIFGLVVVYDRHSDQSENGSYKINLANCHNKVFHVLFYGAGISFMQMKLLIGDFTDGFTKNIGYTLNEMAEVFVVEGQWD